MGYYSTQMFSTTKSGYNKLMQLLKEENEGVKYPIDKPWYYKELDNGVIFGFEQIKWYGNDVDAFERAWERFDEEGYPWTRIRIGEEIGDIEENYSKIAWKTDIPYLFVNVQWEWS